MKKINEQKVSIRDLPTYQKYLNALLRFFDEICRKNDIQYSLAAGTLLGAIRHKDIIPWDDDLDVMMTRDNMEKLKIAMNNYSGRFYLQYLPNHSYKRGLSKDHYTVHWRIFDKKCSTFRYNIDIFPIDFLDSSVSDKEQLAIGKKYIRFFNYSPLFFSLHFPRIEKEHNILKKMVNLFIYLIYPILFIFSWTFTPIFTRRFLKFDNSLKQKYGDKKFVGYAPFLYGHFFDNDWFPFGKEYIEVEIKSKKYLSIGNYHSYLTALYGDYMILPAENNRGGHVFSIKCDLYLDDEIKFFLAD